MLIAFLWSSWAAYAALLSYSALRKNRFLLIFSLIFMGLHTFVSTQLAAVLTARWPPLIWPLGYAQLATFWYFARFGRGEPSWLSRVFVSWPASWFSAAVFLALPWGVASAAGHPLPWPWLPFALAGFGFLQSIYTRQERRSIVLDGQDAGPLRRYERPGKRLLRRNAAGLGEQRPLRVVQISDPHLGPFMSEQRLRKICERAVAQAPDLVLLTGDFLTLETQRSPEPLARSLAPLAALQGRVFACFGNHDHEAPELVREALARAHVTLLVDDAAELDTPWGTLQLVGADHRWRGREQALRALAQAHPRKPGRLRVWLLHDPGAFQAIPEGEADLVFSGHTHGGHLGLLSVGLPHTVVSAATEMPDHGVWARGRDRLYVHRGTGHYGFPLRIGVPAEESVLEVYRAPAAT